MATAVDQRKEKIKALLPLWQRDPEAWGKVHCPDIKWYREQSEALKSIGELCYCKMKRYDHLHNGGPELTQYETEMAQKVGVSIMSAQDQGKDFLAAFVNWWFLSVFKFPKLMATANNDKQLKNVFWSEMQKIAGLSLVVDDKGTRFLNQLFEIQSEKIYMKKYAGGRWFLEGVVASRDKDSKGETLAGRHEDFMLYTLDEASALPDHVFEPLEGSLGGIVNIILVIFNPTRVSGFAVDSHMKHRSRWVCHQWNAEETERGLANKDKAAYMCEKYGRNSNIYRIRILGLPPISEADSLIPHEWVVAAVNRYIAFKKSGGKINPQDRIIGSADVGGGKDPSIFYAAAGMIPIGDMQEYDERNTDVVQGRLKAFILENNIDWAFLDNIGIGHQMYQSMRKDPMLKGKIFACDYRSPTESKKFVKKKDQIGWKLRGLFERNEIMIPDDDELISQCSTIKYSFTKDGKIKIETKDEMKARGVSSPNKFDALAIRYSHNDKMTIKELKAQEVTVSGRYKRLSYRGNSNTAWMRG